MYALDRWGATLFYVDSNVDANGAPLDASIFQQVASVVPDSLIIPEHSTPKYYAYTAPFQSFIFHTDLGTPADVYGYYPHAFSANLINDVDPVKLAQYRPQLTDSARRGDILMAHADYWQTNNPTIVAIYEDAGFTAPAPVAPAPAPVQPTPVPAPTPTPTPNAAVTILSPSAGQSLSGTVTVTAQITHTLDAAGSYLMVDGKEWETQRATNGPYGYALDTTTLANGRHTLQVWAHDTGNSTLLSAPLTVAVLN